MTGARTIAGRSSLLTALLFASACESCGACGEPAAPVEPDAGAPSGGTTSAVDPAPAPPPAAGITADVEGEGVTRRVGEGAFEPLPAGAAALASGTELEVPEGATVTLARGEQTAVVAGPAHVRAGDDSGALVHNLGGLVTGRIEDGTLIIEIPGGSVEMDAEATVSVAGDAAAYVTPRRGGATVRTARGEHRIRAGQYAAVSDEGEVDVRADVRLASADLTLEGHGSAVLHDPHPPTRVRVPFGERCAGGHGSLEVGDAGRATYDGIRVRGVGAAIVELEGGRHEYRVRCDNVTGAGIVATGLLTVEADVGSRPLPSGAQRAPVDADGRRYTVVYQNLLPTLLFRWPGAPTTGPYTLVVQGAGRNLTLRGDRPAQTVPSGRLPHGAYQFHFEAGGRQSRVSTLRIEFRGAAGRVAWIDEPADGAAARGGSVTLAGGALGQSRVRVLGGPALELDAAGRFRQVVSVAGRDEALAVQVSHPQAGTHLYLRHFAGASR